MISKNRNNFEVIKKNDVWMFKNYIQCTCHTKAKEIPLDNILCIVSSKDYITINYLEYCVMPGKEILGEYRLRHARITLLGTMKYFLKEASKCSEDGESTFLRTHRRHITNQRFVFKTSHEFFDGMIEKTKTIWVKLPERINVASIKGTRLQVDEKGLPEILFPLSRTGKKVWKQFEQKKTKEMAQAA